MPDSAPLAHDAAQRQVIEHAAGPLLVLGAPGTGKTTTLVSAVAARAAAGDAEHVLVLTFGRRMADRLRRGIAARLTTAPTPADLARTDPTGAPNTAPFPAARTDPAGTPGRAGPGVRTDPAGTPGRADSAARTDPTEVPGTARFRAEPTVRTFPGYAFGLLRRAAVARGGPPPRLLSGPEQDVTIRELLAVGRAEAVYDAGWPEPLRAALATRGFVGELRDLLARAAERGVTAAQLARWGRESGRGEWIAAARFADQYASVRSLRDATPGGSVGYDPAELTRAAIDLLAGDPELLAAERDRYRWCFVDELHDTDPAQRELLELLAGDGRFLVAFGDPDSSTFAFRGADPAGVTEFRDRFPAAPGVPAPAVTLRTGWRQAPQLAAATGRITARLPGPARHRAIAPAGPAVGSVDVRVFASAAHEAAYLAHALRQAHLLHGVPWSRMAVLVRSTARQLTPLRRALTQAGVPIRVAAEDLPLSAQSAVAPLLLLLRCALRPDTLDEDSAVALLHSPLGGADPFTERQLRQGLRALALPGGDRRPSGVLLLEALRRPVELAAVDRRWAAPAVRIAELLATARRAAAQPGAGALDVLWAVWSHSGLEKSWLRLAAAGGQRGAAADRDLDAVLALFDAARRFTERLPGAAPVAFADHVAAQQLPGDSLAPTAERGPAVRILTVHAAKGAEWDLVAVPGVQEGAWPDLRLRGSLLGSELVVDLAAGRRPEPGTEEPADPPVVGTAAQRAALLDEERRLFYVAATRARHRLLVSAVAAGDGEELPSRFLTELSTVDTERVATVPRALTLPALVAELRTVLVDPSAPPERQRAAARQLARLAAAGVTGAHPNSWWGMGELSDARPLAGVGETVEVSPSTVENVRRCGLRWALERHGGANPPGVEQSVGTLVHAAAAEADDLGALRKFLDEHWDEVEFPARWVVGKKRVEADRMLDKLAEWLADNPRRLAATERRFRTRLPSRDDAPDVELTGAVDRLEVDDAGRPVIIDLKTGGSAPTDAQAAQHPQLGAYQVAAEHGAFDDLPGVTPGAGPGGAALVQLGGSRAHPREQHQPALADADNPAWAQEMVHDAARRMAAATFDAVINEHCRSCAVQTSCPLSTHGRRVTDP
ncbi:ATP-dependent helicase [Actinocatenispora comari]|uniref:ATP-dependent helicase n=1 Tax=Actinocatenispora comari TaxID=2807577 RepID=UPI001CEC302A|nr:ATP-dependent DNA helicase [Actinocatenispora comari]